MLIDFFYTLRSAKLPVSVKEYLTLVEALKEGVVGPSSDGAFSIDDFYYLSRTVPSRRRAWCRSTPSFFAPSRSMARWLAKL